MTDFSAVRRQLRRLHPLTVAGFEQALLWYLDSTGRPVLIGAPLLANAPVDITITTDDSLVILTVLPRDELENDLADARDTRYAQALGCAQAIAPLRVQRCVIERCPHDSLERETVDYDALELVNPFAGAVETRMVEHMNDDHSAAMRAYCALVGIALDQHSPSMIGIDSDGFDLLLEGKLVRVEFPQACVTPLDARQGLVELAERGRSTAATTEI